MRQLEERHTGPRARAARSGSAASRSSGRGTRPDSRSARSTRGRAAPARRAPAAPRRRARPRARRGRRARAPGAAQTANTIGRPVRSSQSRPRSWCGVGSSNADFERRVADQELRVGLLAERHVLAPRAAAPSSARPRWRDSGVTATVRTRSSGSRVTSWIESTAPSERDAEPRQQPQPVGVARVLDRRDRRDVELAGEQPPVQLGRHARRPPRRRASSR